MAKAISIGKILHFMIQNVESAMMELLKKNRFDMNFLAIWNINLFIKISELS